MWIHWSKGYRERLQTKAGTSIYMYTYVDLDGPVIRLFRNLKPLDIKITWAVCYLKIVEKVFSIKTFRSILSFISPGLCGTT